MLSVKQSGIKYHLWVFDMTRPGIEPSSPEPLKHKTINQSINQIEKKVFN